MIIWQLCILQKEYKENKDGGKVKLCSKLKCIKFATAIKKNRSLLRTVTLLTVLFDHIASYQPHVTDSK